MKQISSYLFFVLFYVFCVHSSEKREEYGHMVKLLLQVVKAERTGNWELHMLSVSAMVP